MNSLLSCSITLRIIPFNVVYGVYLPLLTVVTQRMSQSFMNMSGSLMCKFIISMIVVPPITPLLMPIIVYVTTEEK